ncbi:prenyltransferase/squalene oxidase repeat-containing protein [Planctomycetota bacterium]
MRSRCFLLLLGLLTAFAASPGRAGEGNGVAGQRPGDAGALPPRFREITPELEQAVQGGLRFLAGAQKRDGSWRGGDYPVAVTALCGLAFLATGSTPAGGEHAQTVREAITYLRRRQQRSGLFAEAGGSRPMYGHGFTLLFLAECCGMTARETSLSRSAREEERDIRKRLRAAVRLIEESRSVDGGWYYTPGSGEDEGSVTITQIQGLRAARNAGIYVPKVVIDGATDYVRRSQDPDGGVRYTVHYGRSSLALTAAGLAVLFGAGDYDSRHVALASGYVRAHLGDAGPSGPHFYYTQLYAAQAMFQLGGTDWETYFPRIREELLARRSRRGGSWDSNYGRPYATAIAILVLSLPYRYLPSFAR